MTENDEKPTVYEDSLRHFEGMFKYNWIKVIELKQSKNINSLINIININVLPPLRAAVNLSSVDRSAAIKWFGSTGLIDIFTIYYEIFTCYRNTNFVLTYFILDIILLVGCFSKICLFFQNYLGPMYLHISLYFL